MFEPYNFRKLVPGHIGIVYLTFIDLYLKERFLDIWEEMLDKKALGVQQFDLVPLCLQSCLENFIKFVLNIVGEWKNNHISEWSHCLFKLS